MFVPLQHIHPMLVHFPIVFFFTAVAFDIGATLTGRNVAGRTTAGAISLALVTLAALSAIATWMFGHMALDVAEAGGFHSDVAEMHETLGGLTTLAFVVWAAVRGLAWWRNVNLGGLGRAIVPAVGVAGAILVTATAWFGGELVYSLGVNVARLGGAG